MNISINATVSLTWLSPIPAFDLGEGGEEYSAGSGTALGSIPNMAKCKLTNWQMLSWAVSSLVIFREAICRTVRLSFVYIYFIELPLSIILLISQTSQ